jgi:hypothetical protein
MVGGKEEGMFIQVIRGTVADLEGLRRQVERWQEELRPGATGYLGTTAGVTGDGRLVVMARFESVEAAARNSQRAEQGNWWAETEKCLHTVSFQESVAVDTLLGGGKDNAGFVQVLRGRVKDPQKLDALGSRKAEIEAALRAARPDVIGDVMVMTSDGAYIEAVYFSSEAEARRNEARPLPDEMAALMGEFDAAIAIDEYLDLGDPWLR